MQEISKSARTRRRVAGTVSVLLVIALLLGGTYAFMDYDQHKSNEFDLSGLTYRVTLNEDFEEVKDWNVNNAYQNKDISVTNTGYTDGTYGNVYVRLQLREFMEVTPMKYNYTPNRYMVARPSDSDPTKSDFVDEINALLTAKGAKANELAQFGANSYDNFITFNSAKAAENFLSVLKSDSRWADTLGDITGRTGEAFQALDDVERDADGKVIVNTDGTTNPITRYYIQTTAKDPNGQYGKYIPLSMEIEGGPQTITERLGKTPANASADAEAKHDHGTQNCLEWMEENDADCPTSAKQHDNGECEYLVHLWGANGKCEECDLTSHEYVKWYLGEDVITLADWKAGGGKATAKWIVDTDSPEGWVYWGQALVPGANTSKLLDAVELVKQPDGTAYYAIHTDMEAVDYARLSNWGDIDDDIKKAYDDEKDSDSLRNSLIEKIKEGEKILADNTTNYTDDSKQALQDAIDAGKAILEDNDADNDDYRKGIDDIDNAIDGLTNKTTDAPRPTEAPTQAPTNAPTTEPTEVPTQAPTEAPTQEPTTEDNVLPTKTSNDPDGYKPLENEEDADYDFRGVLYSIDVHLPDDQRVVQFYPQPDITLSYGYIQLENILAGTDYSNVNITVPTEYKDLVYIGTDRYGKPAIVSKVLPTIAQCRTSYPNNPRILINVTLEQNGKTAGVTLVMTYDGSVGLA